MMSEDGYTKEIPFDFPRNPLCIFLSDFRSVFKFDELGLEIARIALPAALALTADPIASLVDTAFIGQIGPVELAAVGVSIALFNQVSRIAIFPLVSITTSFVAEEDACSSEENTNQDYKECIETGINNTKEETQELIPGNISTPDESKNSCSIFSVSESPVKKRNIPSASSALIIGAILGLLQAVFLISSAKPLLSFMGVKHDSPMLGPAQRYLSLRSLGAPAVLLSLATQGVFRGFKDTTTPLYATVIGDVTNIILDPIFIFVFRLGVTGAATAHVISHCTRRTHFHGSFPSLLAGLVSNFTSCRWVRCSWPGNTCECVCQKGLQKSCSYCFTCVAGLHFGARLFTKDDKVLHLISIGLPFVAGTQPINALAFVFDGVNFGASDFGYAAASLVMVAIVSVLCLVLLSATHGFIGLWFGLTIYMSLRAAVGFWRIGTATGPWSFLRR
ncbi:protein DETOXIFICATION 42 isoform X3 [Brassica napus]|uniref:protein DETOXIFICATION 42 isoform X3 n=1 Tax=Brassica napus TaxID=3708 RepID=UPI002079165B|nr:protein DETOXIFICATION 42 isoform X3 [Brassica napus]